MTRRSRWDTLGLALVGTVGLLLLTAAGGTLSVEGGAFGAMAAAIVLLVKALVDTRKGAGADGGSIERRITWQVELTAAIRDLQGSMERQADHFERYVIESQEYRRNGVEAMEKIDQIQGDVTRLLQRPV